MPIVFTWAGLARVLGGLLRPEEFASNDWSLGLFVNDYVPTLDTVLGDFVEAAFPGYAREDLLDAEWVDPVEVSDRLESTYGEEPLTWTNGGSIVQNVFGYFIVDNDDGLVLLAEKFDAPRVMSPTAVLEATLVIYSRNDPSPPSP